MVPLLKSADPLPGREKAGPTAHQQGVLPLLSHDLSGLPPAFLSVGAVDTLRDENIAYAARLLQAGVPVELHVWPGVYHAVEFQTPQCPTSRRILSEYSAALKRAFSPPL